MGKGKVKDPNKVSIGKFLAWQSRGVSFGALMIVTGYITIFCTDTLKMSPALVGTLLMASKIFDGVTDVVAGYVVDNTNSRWGKGRPYEWCIVGSWLCTLLLFYTPVEWSMQVKSIWVFVTYTFIFSIFNTLLNTCANPYTIRAFKGNSDVIAKVSAYGGVLISICSVAVSVTFPILMGTMATSNKGWRQLITIYAVPMAVIGILRFVFVKEDPSIDAGNSSRVQLKQIFQMMKKNKYIWYYALISGFNTLIMGINAGSYYFTYVVGNVGLFGVVQMVGMIALPVMIFFPLIMRKSSVYNLIAIGTVMGIAGNLLIFFAKANIPLLMAAALLTGIAQLPLSYLQAIIVMQLSDYNEAHRLPRMEGCVGIVSGLFSKLGNAAGAGIIGALLAVAGYVGGAAVQTDGAIMAIRCSFSIIPMICMIGMLIFTFKLMSLNKMLPQLREEIEKHRQKAEA